VDPLEYKKRIENEKNFYDKSIYNENLTEKTSPALAYFLDKFQHRVQNKLGLNVWDYVVSTVNEKIKNNNEVKFLSLGSGPGGAEMDLAKKFQGKYSMDCIDINEESIRTGQNRANELDLNLKFIQQDLNQVKLLSNHYDIIFAHASLHHLINHEHVANQVKSSMKIDGVFIVYDMICRNGMRIWPETKEVANKIFSKLPEKYRFDSIIKDPQKKFRTEIKDEDVGLDGFECIRSQDLYPVLKKIFKIKIEIPGFSFARRFVDVPLGKNYDLDNNPTDLETLDMILKKDEEYSEKYGLKPESIFLVLEK